ncbi:MAG: carbohydrate kinase [Alphaproteobacteria bacterium RIFOXYD12_FULL_60_8]|nr:MAG: carbohydrate kinase [Alphaproteobacteria bacterium RIFOXYD12_FULL_60_8]
MSETRFDVLCIGNAIVDVLAHAEDSFLATHGMVKGSMALIDEARAHHLYDHMGPGLECSGGSAANTAAGVASLGGRPAYIGKTNHDTLGEIFAHDLRASGVHFATSPLSGKADPATARCLILVSPDAQRTMNTFLGACTRLRPEDIDEAVVRESQVVYIEGYLWDMPEAKDAIVKAARLAREAGRGVALSLSDAFCVDRHRDEFQTLVADHVDIVFANEDEIKSLYCADTFDAALQQVRAVCKVAALTRGAKGSVVLGENELHIIDAEPMSGVVDTTGAGDLYAAGFLFGYTQGKDLATCARLGGIAAAEVISHFGARPEADLKGLVAQRFSL